MKFDPCAGQAWSCRLPRKGWCECVCWDLLSQGFEVGEDNVSVLWVQVFEQDLLSQGFEVGEDNVSVLWVQDF
jgi:uncharacterized lipoprotein YajG